MIQAYSVKAKQKVEVQDPILVKTQRGGFMVKGKCPLTGVTVCAMVSKEKAEELLTQGIKKTF